ncbi:MAG TPA: MFS transporter [Acetobacteraceae bacterium]|nr:MFS transporter [Acetobacteraceae bacterium]
MTQAHAASRASLTGWLFWSGTAAVTVGVALHLPMFAMARSMGYRLAGMPMDPGMLAGMVLIVGGTIASGAGLLRLPAAEASVPRLPARPKDTREAPLTAAHWWLMLTLALALVIDMMKPATLGFVVPGTAQEYGLTRPTVALLPFAGLSGTAIGSYVWGALADRAGRRGAILLAAIMFIGTSICGAMPSFGWNLVMCFLMGLAAGGLMPIAYTLLGELVPARHRGWFLVLLGGVGLVGGYVAASGAAALLEPRFGWRIMWFLGLPTGLMLILLNRFVPESPSFLMLRGDVAKADAIMARFGVASAAAAAVPARTGGGALLRHPFGRITLALNLCAFAWGLVNYGLLLWLPADLRARGFGVAASDALLARSALIALPTVIVTAWLYHRWSTKRTLVLVSLLTVLGLLGVPLLGSVVPVQGMAPVVLIAVLMVGSGGVIAVLPPFSVESYPVSIRGRGTGLVAGSSKLGGIAAQVATMGAAVPQLAAVALVLAAPVLLGALFAGRFGRETRGRRLAEIDAWRP